MNHERNRRFLPYLLEKLRWTRGERGVVVPIEQATPSQTKSYVEKIMEEQRRCEELLNVARPLDRFHLENEREREEQKRKEQRERNLINELNSFSVPQSPSMPRPSLGSSRTLYPHFTMRPMSPLNTNISENTTAQVHFTPTQHSTVEETIILNQPTTEFFISTKP